ncbi:mechanosensitive ion channel family protein [Halogeometricum borinquense]|uniref:Mechanosensitive ion channel family protein n=1 Tax=Halogeometricum borinquense TaxID=60847 RepID=A0A6C0ULH1_9EURY|nr:mechanosensitive ion channel family protein [Halogeometricum borinquense]QIB73768.1 mechanosensitive ion channel family protein [Halogeometricum borinquense]QIQ76875.1 mechanosensitive ion channel family protein [Halogeometricum borinquense]
MNVGLLVLQQNTGGGLYDAIGRALAGFGIPESVAVPLGRVIAFVAAFVAVYLLGRIVVFPVLNRMMDSRSLEDHAQKPLRRVTSVVVVFVGITVAFGAAGFENFLQSLATIAAAATLAIGFAMQDVLQNFVAGIFIFTDKPFRIGDWIEWDGNSGVVEDISFRVSRIRTFDNELLTVPNSQLTDGVIKNPVAKDTLRLQVPFGIGYGDDIDTAADIILEEARAHPEILDDPGPTVRLTELGGSSVVLTSRFWISNPSRADFVKTKAEYTQRVKERFDEQGIDIPYPNRTLSGELTVAGLEEVAGPLDD